MQHAGRGEEGEEERQQGKVKRTSFLRQQLDCFVVVVAVTVCLFSYSFILHLSFDSFPPPVSLCSSSAAVNLFNLKDSVCSLASL